MTRKGGSRPSGKSPASPDHRDAGDRDDGSPGGVIDGPKAFVRAFETSFPVSRETLDRLAAYEDLLKRWQKTINLVAPSTLNEVWHRHFADSAQLWTLRPMGPGRWVDLGSGAGFPGMVLAILAAESGETRHTLVESDTRKAAFLAEVARKLGLAVDIISARIEFDATRAKLGEIKCVSARALAPLPRLLALAEPYFGPDTTALFLKGRDVGAEIAEARSTWSFDARLTPSLTSSDGAVVTLTGLKRT
ncbi:MAG: 16S rRNA (guanine(527)-N(7))-methyltransferase RsmG [Hyphomicrobium sp.]